MSPNAPRVPLGDRPVLRSRGTLSDLVGSDGEVRTSKRVLGYLSKGLSDRTTSTFLRSGILWSHTVNPLVSIIPQRNREPHLHLLNSSPGDSLLTPLVPRPDPFLDSVPLSSSELKQSSSNLVTDHPDWPRRRGLGPNTQFNVGWGRGGF